MNLFELFNSDHSIHSIAAVDEPVPDIYHGSIDLITPNLDVLNRTLDLLSKKRKALIHTCPGSGITPIQLALIEHFNGKKILFVTHYRPVLIQFKNTVQSRLPSKSMLISNIQFMIYRNLRNLLMEKEWCAVLHPQFDIILLDDIRPRCSELISSNIKMILAENPECYLVGFSNF